MADLETVAALERLSKSVHRLADRVERERGVLSSDLREEIRSEMAHLHDRIEDVKRDTTRPTRLAGGIGTAIGAGLVTGLIILWQWLRSLWGAG